MRDAICQFIDRATPFKACCEAGDGVAAIEKAKERVPATKIVGFTTFDEKVRTSLLATSAFDKILSKYEGLAKLVEAINTLLPASDPFSSWRI